MDIRRAVAMWQLRKLKRDMSWIKSPSVFTEEFVSADQTITAGGQLTLTHGLGGAPKEIEVWLECQSAEDNYAAGDQIKVDTFNYSSTGSNSKGCAVGIPNGNTTQVKVYFGSDAATFGVPDASTGARADLTNANWRAIIKARR